MPEQRYRHASDVAVVDEPEDNVVYVAKLPSGPLLILRGSAAGIWRLITAENVDPIAPLIEPGIEDGQVRAAVTDFVEDLVGRGLIVPT